MFRHAAFLSLLIGCALSASIAGDAQGTAPPAEIVVLDGIVTADDAASTPLLRAHVAVTWTGGAAQPVFTDDRGRFSIAVPRGIYLTIAATKAGYAPLLIGREPDSSDEPVQIRMPKGAVITGSVIDSAGMSVSGAAVRIRRVNPSGQTYSTGEYQTDTDDRGEFRVGSLPAGTYAVLLSSSATRPVLGDRADPGSLVEVAGGGESAVLRIEPRGPVSAASATSYAAGFNAGVAAAAGALPMQAKSLVQGRVLDESGRPVSAVMVGAFAIAGGAGPVGASDATGRYEIRNLAAGTYRLVANSRSGPMLVSQRSDQVVFSMRTLEMPQDGPGQLVVIGPGEQLTGVDLTLQRGAVITGSVVDDAGEPLEGVTVQAWSARNAGGRTVLQPVRSGPGLGLSGRRTDDRGQYRLFDLPPGSYYVVATDTPSATSAAPATGRLIFYPASLSPAAASPVTVHAGAEVFAAITFSSDPLAEVEGRVFDEAGEPFSGSISLSPRARDGMPVAPPRGMQVNDGTFRFSDVPPGEYVVHAFARTPPNVVLLNALGGYPIRFGIAFVSALPNASAPVVIQTGSGSSLRGRVLVDGDPGQRVPLPMSVSGVAVDPELSPAEGARAGRVQSDGTFEVNGLFGPMRFAIDAPAGWRLQSLYIDGVNAADDPVPFGTARQSRAGVDVIITRAGGEIAGRVTGAPEGRAGALIVAGPTDPAGWYQRSRFVKLTTADREGQFTLSGLPPGQFIVAAIDAASLRPGVSEQLSQEDIRLLMPGATHVSLAADARATVEVRLTRLPD